MLGSVGMTMFCCVQKKDVSNGISLSCVGPHGKKTIAENGKWWMS
jgi:hypothetical protein